MRGGKHETSSAPSFDVVCLSHLRWEFVWQRPQHLLSRCAQERRVFFVEEPLPAAGAPRLDVRVAENGVIVCVPRLPAEVDEEDAVELQADLLHDLAERHEIHRCALWFYTPMALPLTKRLSPLAVVYDCMDELSAFAGAPPEMQTAEEALFRRADVVFTGGRSLYEAKRHRHHNVHLFRSSVDVAHFARARAPQPEPKAHESIPSPRLGFVGVIDERLDVDLLAGVAALRPDWQFVLVGPVTKIEERSLPRARNIHYLGAADYDDLPRYLTGWDVGLLPFARNDATRYISPTKTPEYLAAGLPVVSTSIADVVDQYEEAGLVRIADEPAAFVAACEEAMAEDSTERQRRADRFLTEISWDFTWADMSAVVAKAVTENAAAPKDRRRRRPPAFDALVVGAGFAGAVFAERLASQLDRRVLVVDKRPHVGGNAFDHYDDAGVLVHRYGPHIFHTNSREVFDYLSQFTDWRPYEHRVLASVDGLLVPFPINLDTINELYNLDLSPVGFDDFLASRAEDRSPARTSEDVVVSTVGQELYLKFFRNYTRKQWGLDPSELDASVTARVPTRNSRDGRYFTDVYQAMPLHGYTRMFERMLDHPNIKLLLNADYREVEDLVPHDLMVYTGPIDEFFDLRYGKLPYRSLEFRFQTHETPVFQPGAVVNFPNEHPYTRCTEFKYLTGQEHHATTVVYEYPTDDGDPYYPVPRPENAELYARYKQLAAEQRETIFVGRLATYRYYNMDQVVAQSLATFRRLCERADEVEENALRPPTRSIRQGTGRRGARR